MSAPLREAEDPYEQARCFLPGCGAFLHMVVVSDQPIYLSFTETELAEVDADSTWYVECENGHRVLVPVDNGEPFMTFGQCRCEPGEETGDLCGHTDMDRLRKVIMPAETGG